MNGREEVVERRGWMALTLLSVAGAAVINVWRIQFGVDFTDEAFYAALATMLERGVRPLVDEWNLAQFAALPLIPIVKLTGMNGVILLLRIANVVMRAAAAMAVAWSLREWMSRSIAVLAALFTFAMVPYDLPSVSYNTVGALALTAGCFIALGSSPRRHIAAGALHAIAAWAYPPLAIAAGTAFVFGAIRDRRFIVRYIGGAAIASLPWIATILINGVGAFRHVLGFAGSMVSPRPFGQRVRLAAQLFLAHPPYLLLAAAIVVLALVALRRVDAARWALPIVPVAAFLEQFPVLYATLGFTSWLALLGLVASCFLWRDECLRPLITGAIIPGVIAGTTTAISSSNAAVAFGVGSLPAAQAMVAMLVILSGRRVIAFAVASLCWFIPSVEQYWPTAVYRDDDVWRLSARVPSGPYAHIRTSPAKLAWLLQIQSDIARIEKPGGRIFFFYDFPAGYLMSRSRSASPTTWTMPIATARASDRLPGLFAERGWPDVMVRLRRIPFTRTIANRNAYLPADPLNAAFRDYRVAIARDDYDILILAGR